jgi:hypothetical protein
MAVSRKRPSRRLLWTLAVLVLLPSGYIGGAATLYGLAGAGLLPNDARPAARAYIQPLKWYRNSGLPGGRLVMKLMLRAGDLGSRWRE